MSRTASSNYVQKMESDLFWVEEIPVGSINGSNTSFTLSQTPNPISSAEYRVNGNEQTYATEYTISGTTLTTVKAYPTGTTHYIRYRVEPE